MTAMRADFDPRRIEVIDDEMAAIYRARTGAQKIKIASDPFASARRMLASHLAAEHPDWEERQVREERRGGSSVEQDELLRRAVEAFDRLGVLQASRDSLTLPYISDLAV